MAFEQRFLVTLPFGSCAGVVLPERAPPEAEWPAALHADERAFAQALGEARLGSWIAGRVALRSALASAGLSSIAPILPGPRGEPLLPPGVTGSLSHKAGLAVAIAAPTGAPPRTLGIDLEELRPLRADIAGRVLTDGERAALPADGPDRDARVLRIFSAKEAIYKALAPWLGRYIGFQEAQVTLHTDGTLSAALNLAGGEGPFSIELRDLGDLAGRDHLLVVAVAGRG